MIKIGKTFKSANKNKWDLIQKQISFHGFWKYLILFFFIFRKKAEVSMEGQFLVRQIYDDEITYNIIGAAVEVLSKLKYL